MSFLAGLRPKSSLGSTLEQKGLLTVNFIYKLLFFQESYYFIWSTAQHYSFVVIYTSLIINIC